MTPGLPVPDARTWRQRQSASGDIIAEAEAAVGTPWPWPCARAFARVWSDGDRTEYETAVFAKQRRLNAVTVAALVTGDPRFLDDVVDGVIAFCEQSTWCWPAHDEAQSLFAAVTPQVTAPTIDLGAGEVAGLLAWIDAALGDDIDASYPGVRARIRHEVRTRIVLPLRTRRDWWWLRPGPDRINNWTPWICANLIAAAVQLCDGQDRQRLLDDGIAGVELFLASLPADGAVDEGYHYWWAGVARALDAVEILQHARLLEGALEVATQPDAVLPLVQFPTRMHLSRDWVVSHSDSQARAGRAPWRLLHHWARVCGDVAGERLAASHRSDGIVDLDESCGRVLQSVADPHWVQARPASPAPATDVWLPSVQVRVVRPGHPSGLTLVVKGGHNGENHNHNDVGSVSIAVGGQPLAIDAGREEYTAQTFSADRYQLWFTQSQWHNVPMFSGQQQQPGRQFAARGVMLDGATRGVRLDLTDAYPAGAVVGASREAVLDGADVRVTDTWERGEGVVHWLVCAQPHPDAGGLRLHLPGQRPVWLTWEGAGAATIDTRELGDHRMRTSFGPRLWRIALAATATQVTSRWSVHNSAGPPDGPALSVNARD